MNAAAKSISDKFNTKKAELATEIAAETTEAWAKYVDFGGGLYKYENVGDFVPSTALDHGEQYSFEAVGSK